MQASGDFVPASSRPWWPDSSGCKTAFEMRAWGPLGREDAAMDHRSRRGTWLLVVGVMLGALVAPRVAEAVGSIVTIQGGGSTTKAAVTKEISSRAQRRPRRRSVSS